MSELHDYRAFGLRIRSAVPLRFLERDEAGPPDVRIEFGDVSDDERDTYVRNWSASPGRLLLRVRDKARLLVTAGNLIRIQASRNILPHELMSHIQGSAFAALLMQRGLLPLHASCIETTQGAVLAIGSSGLGKSTLLGALTMRGFRMIADDVTAIEVREGMPIAIPAYPAIRMWSDSLASIDQPSEALERVRPELEKYYLPVASFRQEPQPIHAVIVLGVHNLATVTLTDMAPAQAIAALARFTYRKTFLAPLGVRRLQFGVVSALAGSSRIINARRPSLPLDPQALARAVVEELGLAPLGASGQPIAA